MGRFTVRSGKRFHINDEGKGDGHEPQAVSDRGGWAGCGGHDWGLAGCAPGLLGVVAVAAGGGETGAATLSLAWWGNPTRNKNTEAMIDAYMKANPNVKITAQPGEFASYWDKLATQTAGGTAPDIIQMDMNYISEYGTRGALLDLGGVDTSKFVEGTVDSGRINDKLVGINAGINSALFFANPKVFEKAKMDLPDDTTWTWDQMIEVGTELAAKAGVPLGVAELFGQTRRSARSCASTARSSSLRRGLGLTWLKLKPGTTSWSRARKPRPLARPSRSARRSAKPLDQKAIVLGNAAMFYSNSNQLEAISNAAGGDYLMEPLRGPSMTGKATDRKTWYKASMLWSASAKTKNPDAAVAWINWFANDQAAADIDKAERGIPPNTEILAAVDAQAVPGPAEGGEVHHRHQARGGQHPHRPTSWRRHDSRSPAPSRNRCDLRGGQALPTPRRSSWTS